MVIKKPKMNFTDVWIDAIGKMGEQMREEKQIKKSTIDSEGYQIGKDEMELMVKINKLIDEYEYPNGSYKRTMGCEISFIDTNTDIMHNYSYNGENFVKIGEILWETRNQRKTK